MAESIHAAALQIRVGMDTSENMAALERLLAVLPAGTLAIAPEGSLSGYLPEPGFVTRIDQAATDRNIARMAEIAGDQGLHIIAGACIFENGAWLNSSFYFGPKGERARYDKINLAHSERGTFTPGRILPVFDLDFGARRVRVAIQMCREIRYPEQWRVLAAAGAEVFAYVNNAIGSPHGDVVWRAHMMSRASETQRFIVGANNSALDQTCPTMIVAPSGLPLAEIAHGEIGFARADLNLNDVTNWVIDQARADVVRVSPA